MNFRKSIAKLSIFSVSLATFTLIGATQQYANAHTAVSNGENATNISLATITNNGALVVATTNDDDAAAIYPATAVAGTFTNAFSLGLVAKDATSGTAQTATVRPSGVLSLYSRVSTSAATSADGGTFSGGKLSGVTGSTADATYNAATTSAFFSSTIAYATTGTPIAVLWTAPSIAGTYTIQLHVSGTTAATTVSADAPTVGTQAGKITVTVAEPHGTTVSVASTGNRNAQVGLINGSLFTANELTSSGSAAVSSITTVACESTDSSSESDSASAANLFVCFIKGSHFDLPII